MLPLLGRRIVGAIPTILLATLAVVALVRLIPGDPAQAMLGDSATPERLAELRAELGLDRPFPEQYADWVIGALTGDLGRSLQTGESVSELISSRLPATLHLLVGAILVAVVLGVVLGTASALWPGSLRDTVITGIATTGIAVPNFWLALLLVTVFSLRLGWLPATGFVDVTSDPVEGVRRLVLPSLALGVVGAAEIARQIRSALLDVLQSDYMRTHKAFGIPTRTRLFKFALKNAALPVLTVLGLMVNRFVGGTVIIESVFALPGLGSLVVGAVNQRDFPVIQGVAFVTILVVVATSLLTDLAYRWADPRIRV